jgi:type VI protein secretion system component Hcp
MARDAYIKFGERDEKGPDGKPLPLIEGDSSDAEHYWWTELRGYDFGISAGERPRDTSDQPNEERSRPELGDVTITKKVDWGSADLFRKCCEAAEATTKRSDERQGKGKIDKVVIEICRQSGVASEGRIPFVTITYHDVYVVKYTVDISEPEPIETVVLKCEKSEFEYVPTDPFTGGRLKGGSKKTSPMVQHKQVAQVGATITGPGATVSPGAAVPAAAGVAAAMASTAAAAPSANGVPAGAAPATTEGAVSANFPGLWPGTGFGILPD